MKRKGTMGPKMPKANQEKLQSLKEVLNKREQKRKVGVKKKENEKEITEAEEYWS